jgi:hypothetical protein
VGCVVPTMLKESVVFAVKGQGGKKKLTVFLNGIMVFLVITSCNLVGLYHSFR